MANERSLRSIQEGTAEFRDYAYALATEYTRLRSALFDVRDAFEESPVGNLPRRLYRALSMAMIELDDIETDDDDDGFGD